MIRTLVAALLAFALAIVPSADALQVAHTAGAGPQTRRSPVPAFTFVLTGQNFVYTDADRTFTGVLVKPAGNGPFPAAIVSHGQGGSAGGYSLSKAQQFQAFGMVSIAPNYTHAIGGETAPALTGNCPENVARGIACLNVLRSLAYVDATRIALWGHSKGAYATIGIAAAAPQAFRAAAFSAGGIVPDAAGTGAAAPTMGEAASVATPFLMFHGDADTVVSPSQSLLFDQLLGSLGVPRERVLYATSQHNLHQVPSIDADMLARYHVWLQTWGVVP